MKQTAAVSESATVVSIHAQRAQFHSIVKVVHTAKIAGTRESGAMLPETVFAALSTGAQLLLAFLPAAPLLGQKPIATEACGRIDEDTTDSSTES
jgi:hypothetical protein